MNFATLPPETNSGRMYLGPGAAPMIQAAEIWDGLAAQLHDAAADYGAAATAFPQAAPYVAWLNATGAQAQQTAARAKAAASAYDSAIAAMVPPRVIESNRARRISLASTNCLGHASPAIADIDADYERMWAQDARAMYAYARASADASALTRFSSPPSATRAGPGGWALTAAPEVIATGNQVMSAIPEALEALSVSPLRSFAASLSPVTVSLSKLSSLSAPLDVAIGELSSLNKAAVLENAAALYALLPARAGGAASPSGFGCGVSIGALSVPAAWATATAPRPVVVEASQSGWGFEPIRLVKGTAPTEV